MALELKVTRYTGCHVLLYLLPARVQARAVAWVWKRSRARNNHTVPVAVRIHLPNGQAWQVGPRDAQLVD